MDKEREANFLGQFAGVVGVLSAVIQALPDASADVGPGREGAESICDLFLSELAKSEAGRAR